MTANAIRWFMVKERWRVLSSPVVAEPSAVIKSEAVYAAWVLWSSWGCQAETNGAKNSVSVGQGWACGSGSLSAHIRLVGIVEVVVLIRQSPHKCRVVLGLPHEVARGGIPLCGQFHVGIEGLSAVRHVSPSGMFFLPLWTTAGVYGYPDVADGKNRLEEEINFSQRFTTALTWCFSTHATPSCLRALFSS